MSASGPVDVDEIKRLLQRMDKERRELISQRITHLAKAHGSMRKLAKALGIDHVWLWRIAKGKRKPSPRVLAAIGLAEQEVKE